MTLPRHRGHPRLAGRVCALNASYEWTCTSGVGADPIGGVRLLRVLDWRFGGLGRNLVAACQRGPDRRVADLCQRRQTMTRHGRA